jgi:threonine synthase
MKLLAGNRAALENCIDAAIGPETSIVSRYRDAVQFTDNAENDRALKRYLLAGSIREGVRVIQLLTYKGVTIHILDETSWMATGSLKSIDGCLTAALCRMEGAERMAFESGGNSGSALTRYGQHAGLETFFFCPLDNIDLLDSRLFDNRKAHLIGVEDRGQVKALAGLFAKEAHIRHVPDKSWRYSAAMFRGLFILEQMLTATSYDWISQTVSAGFGPIGIYKVLETFRSELHGLPRFLGIQQEANCPMFEAWRPGAEHKEGRLLTRVMYDDSPQTYKTFSDLQQLLLLSRGDLLTINGEEFDSYVYTSAECGRIPDLLLSRDIAISLGSGQVLEKTGMIALAGTLKAIDTGTIAAGSSVLCCLTSGVSQADGLARPELTVRNTRDVLKYAETIRTSSI